MQAGNFDAFLECFSVPLIMETFEGKCLLQTREDIKSVFDAMRAFRVDNAISRFVRENVAATFTDPDTLAATHVSRMLKDGDILFGRPYPAYSLFNRVGDAWKIHYCQYAIDEPAELNHTLLGRKCKAPQ